MKKYFSECECEVQCSLIATDNSKESSTKKIDGNRKIVAGLKTGHAKLGLFLNFTAETNKCSAQTLIHIFFLSYSADLRQSSVKMFMALTHFTQAYKSVNMNLWSQASAGALF